MSISIVVNHSITFDAILKSEQILNVQFTSDTHLPRFQFVIKNYKIRMNHNYQNPID